jgi:hypothetical protein
MQSAPQERPHKTETAKQGEITETGKLNRDLTKHVGKMVGDERAAPHKQSKGLHKYGGLLPSLIRNRNF